MSFSIEGPFIRASFPVMFRLCLDHLNNAYQNWRAVGRRHVAENLHRDIEDTFQDILLYLLNINADDNQLQLKFYTFDRRVYLLTQSIEFLKEQ